jgi:hypothetical protein
LPKTAPRARIIIAYGEAIGSGYGNSRGLKARVIIHRHLTAPLLFLQGRMMRAFSPRGFALPLPSPAGWAMMKCAFGAESFVSTVDCG